MRRYLLLLLLIGLAFWSCENKDEDCPAIYAPVCGSDGVSYGNECYARNAGAGFYKYFNNGVVIAVNKDMRKIGGGAVITGYGSKD